MSAPYIVDANFFIQAHRMHYPMDVVPNFWSKIKELAENGLISSIDKVKAELYLNNDGLTEWCKDNLPSDFFCVSDICINEYMLITNWASSMATHYTPAALSEFLDADEADAWLIAFCLSKQGKIVTHEIGDPNGKKRIKIPDACVPFGINCINTIELFRELGERF